MKLENADFLIKQILEKENISIPAIAHKIGVSPQTIYRILQKKRVCWKSQYKIISYHLSTLHASTEKQPKVLQESFD